MNRIYKKIWNKVRGCYVAVSEAVGTGQSRGKAASVIVGAASAAVLLSPALSVAGNYTDMTFTGDGPDASGLFDFLPVLKGGDSLDHAVSWFKGGSH